MGGGGGDDLEDCPLPPQAVHTSIKARTMRTGSTRRFRVFSFPLIEIFPEKPLRKKQPNSALAPASIHNVFPPRIAEFGLREPVAAAAVTVSVTTAVPFTSTDVGDTLQPRMLAEVVHERLTVPLNPRTDPRLIDVWPEPPFWTTNCGTAGAIVKSGVSPASTAVRVMGVLTDS